jgi:hypothetical protein
MKTLMILMLLRAFFLSPLAFGQEPLTDEQVMAAIDRALTGKRHQTGLTLNDMQTNLFSGIMCKTCKTTGYTIYVYTPESWIELQAVQARREMLPFSLQDVTPEMRLPYIHVLASPSKPEYLTGDGMAMASSVHRVVLSSTERSDVVQPYSESRDSVESNSAFRSFTQASAGAVFSLHDVERLRSEDPKREFFIVVVGDNQNKYFKVKTRFFNQLFGRTSDAEFAETGIIPAGAAAKESTVKSALVASPAKPEKFPLESARTTATRTPSVIAHASANLSASSANILKDESRDVSPQQENRASLLGLRLTNSVQGGAEIARIAPDSAAEAAGFHVGDVIRSVNGKRVRSTADFETALATQAPGSKIALGYLFHTNLGWMQGMAKVLTLDSHSDYSSLSHY